MLNLGYVLSFCFHWLKGKYVNSNVHGAKQVKKPLYNFNNW